MIGRPEIFVKTYVLLVPCTKSTVNKII